MFVYLGISDAAILVFSANGTYTTKTSLFAAYSSADTRNKTIVVTSPVVESHAIAWKSNRELRFGKGGYITFEGSGTLTGLKEARPEWFGVNTIPGTTDMTAAIQNAVNAASKVRIPDGIYSINATRVAPFAGAKCGIQIPSYREIILDEGASLIAIANASDNYAVFCSYDTSNVSIAGGYLYGERVKHTASPAHGEPDQHGFGIDFRGVSMGRISNVISHNFVGDGFYIGRGATGTFSNNIVIDNVESNNNVRQGLSITGANNVKVLNSLFRNTNGTTPAAGIDIESNSSELAQINILIHGCRFLDNVGSGVNILRGQNVTVSDCYFYGNRGGHNIMGSVGGAASSNIKLVNNVYSNSTYNVIEFGDNIDNILIDGNTMYPLLGTGNGFLHYGTAPTTTAHIKVVNNTIYATTSGGYNLVAWGVADSLSEWDVRGNTLYMGNGIQGIDWRGKDLLFNNNILNVGKGATSGTHIALSINVAGKARLNANTFNNSTTSSTSIASSTKNTIFGPDNNFTKYFTNNDIK